MRYRLLCVGKLKQDFLKEACAEYIKRLRPYGELTCIEVPEAKTTTRPSEKEREAQLEEEGNALLQHIRPQDHLIVLDLHGKELSSTDFAAKLADLAVNGIGEITLAIGGAYGLGANLRKRAQFRWALSPLTFTHQMTRYLVLEQLYRAAKINHREPYHW